MAAARRRTIAEIFLDARRLQARRRGGKTEKDFSRDEFAELLRAQGVSVGGRQLRRWEDGKSPPPAHALAATATIVGIDLLSLLRSELGKRLAEGRPISDDL